MLYNLIRYLKNELPALFFVANGLQPESNDDVINVSEMPGQNDYYIDRKDFVVHVLSQATNKVDARKNIYAIYDLLHKKFRLTLPEETVDSTVYPEVKTYRILATQTPTSMGSDENGKNLFSVTFIITTN